jgi:3-deoxy-D-manno-octulosonic-acid transferase
MDPEKIFLTGHTKVDQAVQLGQLEQDKGFALLASLLHNKRVFIAASTHPGEEQTLCQAFQRIQKKNSAWRLLLAPRHPERFEGVADLLKSMGISFIRFSQLNRTGFPQNLEVVLIDRIGILAQLYSIADAAFIGGSLIPIGGHNVWEAAAFGVPMIYGPYMNQDFGLAEEGGALRVGQVGDFSQHLASLLEDDSKQAQMKLCLADFLEKHRGAVEKNLRLLEQIHV